MAGGPAQLCRRHGESEGLGVLAGLQSELGYGGVLGGDPLGGGEGGQGQRVRGVRVVQQRRRRQGVAGAAAAASSATAAETAGAAARAAAGGAGDPRDARAEGHGRRSVLRTR